MYAIELTIGISLILLGLLIVSYFAYSTAKIDTRVPILHISEAIATLAIGILFIACSIVISKMEYAMDLQPVETERVPVNLTTKHDFNQLFDVNNFYNSNHVETIEDVHTVNKTDMDEFLVHYQKFFSDMLNKQIKNDTIKYFYSSNKFYDEKMKRSIDNETDECNSDYKEMHLKYVMLVSSFLYGLMSLINSTTDCDGVKDNQVFVKTKPADTESIISGQSLRDRSIDILNKNKLALQIASSWLAPVFYTLIVYYTMGLSHSGNMITMDMDNIIEIEPQSTDLVALLQKPINVTSTEGKKVNEIVDKIYNIVASVRMNETKKVETTTYPPIMYDIINYFNNRQEKELDFEKCEYKSMPIKLHTLILFIIVYFGVLMYTKNVHTKLKAGNCDKKVTVLGKHIIAFTTLWMPSVLEIFIRIYLVDYKPNVYSDVCLGLGNFSRFVANGLNFNEVREEQKKHTNVSPSA